MSVVMNGRRVEIPGLRTLSFLDPGGPPRTPNCNTNDRNAPGSYKPSVIQPISGAIWHTFHGTANGTILTDGTCGEDHEAMAVAKDFARPSRRASSQFLISDPGTVLNIADLVTDRCWHAGSSEADWNPFTIGIEMAQHKAGGQCAATIAAAVTLAWWICKTFGVQPMLPVTPTGAPDLDNLPRLIGSGARSFYGHWFHAGQDVRGRGDPGPAFPRAFLASGAEGFDIRRGQDLAVWRLRQQRLQMPATEIDGIAGPTTVETMEQRMGRGTWVTRRGAAGRSTSLGEIAFVGLMLTLALDGGR